MGFAYRSGDVAYYQGPRPNLSGMSNVFVNTARCNQGGFQITTYGAQQVALAVATFGFSSYYIFNGAVDAYSAGVAFASSAVPGFQVGRSAILIDCEDEGATGTRSWGPDECIRFAQGVRAVRPDIPVSSFIVYMNYTVNRRFDWSQCVSLGMGLCYARPGGPDDYHWWPGNYARYIKQDGTVNGIDADWHNSPWSVIVGSDGSAPREEEDLAYIVTVSDWDGQTYLCVPGRYIVYITGEGQHLPAAQVISSKMATITSANAQALLDEMAMGNYTADDLKGLPSTASKILVCTALNPPAPDVKLTDSQAQQMAAQIAANVSVGASQEQVQAAVASALKNLTLKAA